MSGNSALSVMTVSSLSVLNYNPISAVQPVMSAQGLTKLSSVGGQWVNLVQLSQLSRTSPFVCDVVLKGRLFSSDHWNKRVQ